MYNDLEQVGSIKTKSTMNLLQNQNHIDFKTPAPRVQVARRYFVMSVGVDSKVIGNLTCSLGF